MKIYIVFLLYLILTNYTFIVQAQTDGEIWQSPISCSELNTEADEFAASWNKYEEQLYFNSTKSSSSRFYTAKFTNSLTFNSLSELKGYLNKPRNNQSYITFLTEDEAYISTFEMYDEGSKLNIFRTYRKKQVWSDPVIVSSLRHDSFNSHPTVSPGGKFIVYSSDRDSEYGDTDLLMSFMKNDGTWSEPMNLSEINSPGNEITPYLASEDTLYFASNGHEGRGGYDIYMSVRYAGLWQRPLPLEAINTEFDESDFSPLPNRTFIFTSNRIGGRGGLDLYLTGIIKKSEESSK